MIRLFRNLQNCKDIFKKKKIGGGKGARPPLSIKWLRHCMISYSFLGHINRCYYLLAQFLINYFKKKIDTTFMGNISKKNSYIYIYIYFYFLIKSFKKYTINQCF